LRTAVLGLATLGLVGCGDDEHSPGQGGDSKRPPIPAACSIPATGCPCTADTVKCGVTVSREGDTLTCRQGERTCDDGAWSECVGDKTTQIYSPPPTAPGVKTQGLATSSVECMDACDPYCQVLADTPDDLKVGKDLSADANGLTLYSAGFTGGNCPDLSITPATYPLVITTINADGTVVPDSVAFDATCSTSNTMVDPSWTTNEPDRSIIASDGTLRIYSGIVGDITVTGASVIDTATAVVNVTVNINEGVTDPAFNAVGSAADPGKTLYPYKNTVFPLDLKAPLVQWQTGGTAATSVQVALRYPAGSATPTFWYSKIFANEPQATSLEGAVQTTGAPSWAIPQAVWNAFGRSAKGATGDIVIQRKNGGTVYQEMVVPVKFATEALRGTVYYTQYLRRLYKVGADELESGQTDLPENYNPLVPGTTTCPTGYNTHSPVTGGSTVRSIDLSTPAAKNQDPFNGANGCPVCHSVSANGNIFVSGSRFLQTYAPPGGMAGKSTGFVNRIALSGTGEATFTVVGEAPNYQGFPNVTDWGGSRGFGFAPLTPDGALALQARYFWGNTAGYGGDNFTIDRASTSGGQIDPLFFVPTAVNGATVQFATTTELTATRTGNVLTATSGGLLPSIDGYTLAVGDSVLVKDQTTTVDNGIYTVTNLGSCGSAVITSSAVATGNVSATSVTGTNTADKAFDNNTGTRWESAWSDPQSITVDLGSSQSIGRVRIDWENAGAKDYTLQVATASTGPWTTIATATNLGASNHRIDDYTCLTATGRYVRMSGTARATGYGYSIYEMDVYAPSGMGGTPYSLTRRQDADDDPGTAAANTNVGSILANWEVRVTRGTANYGHVFRLTSPAMDPTINVDGLTFTDINATPLTFSMTMATISPNGKRIAYVNGASDELDSTAWRKALTRLTFDQTTRTVTGKKRIINNWAPAPGDGGAPIKWPFFESDSRSIVYVQTDPDEYCNGRTGDAWKACNGDGPVFANTSPTQRGYWKGSLFSVDSSAGTPSTTKAELSKLNDAENAWDADKAYQPTVLPDAIGGYRWVIFTSPRSYGNQLNQLGTTGPTHWSCAATMLWVSALDNATATATDRSHPAFFLPGQNVQPIATQDHYINERGYLVRSPCKTSGLSCSSSDECCGGTSCRVDKIPASGAPTKVCKGAADCSQEGNACLTAADCCGAGSSCVSQKCVAVPNYAASATYTRDFVASCKEGFKPRWGLFSYHLTTPSSSHIAFSAKTAATSADLATAMAVALKDSTGDNYGAAAEAVDVGAKLEADKVAYSLAYLRVSMTLSPSAGGAVAPILHDWKQRYSCVPAE
jgi:hypothetical protein